MVLTFIASLFLGLRSYEMRNQGVPCWDLFYGMKEAPISHALPGLLSIAEE